MRAQDIADYVNLTADEVRRSLAALCREGAIERAPDRAIRVANRRRFNRHVTAI
jgi:predicted ArsR family transcriptional regulator